MKAIFEKVPVHHFGLSERTLYGYWKIRHWVYKVKTWVAYQFWTFLLLGEGKLTFVQIAHTTDFSNVCLDLGTWKRLYSNSVLTQFAFWNNPRFRIFSEKRSWSSLPCLFFCSAQKVAMWYNARVTLSPRFENSCKLLLKLEKRSKAFLSNEVTSSKS